MNSVPLRNDILFTLDLAFKSHDSYFPSVHQWWPELNHRTETSRRPFQSHYNKGTCVTGPSTAICQYISARQRAAGLFRIRSPDDDGVSLVLQPPSWRRERDWLLELIEMTFQRNIRHQLIKFKIILDLFNSGDSDDSDWTWPCFQRVRSFDGFQ